MVIINILISLIFLNSCSKNIDYYRFTIENDYFESLYQTKVGNVLFDTILVNKTTPVTIINKGSYDFTTQTASGSILKSNVIFRADRQNVKLIVNKYGKLTIE